MQLPRRNLRIGLATALLLSLAACGGGGGSSGFPVSGGTGGGSSGGGTAPAAMSSTLSGTVATGAAFSDAAVTVIDQTGTTVCTTTTNAQGTYTCTLPAGTKAPLVIKASRDDRVLYSTTASAADGIANVTPLTTIVVAQLSPDGNPASLAGAIQSNPQAFTATTIQTQVAKLVAALKPLLDALGQSAPDLMGGSFAADGTGQDKLLDAISVSVLPNGTTANIEITVKTVPTDSTSAPVSISFNTMEGPQTLPPIQADDLAATPTPAVASALFDRMTACYALPLTQRVDSAINDNTNATGTAANVVAQACKTLFVGDDPATFVSNGYGVGRDSKNAGSFSGLFRAGATGVKFDRGNVEFARANGDFVFSYRTRDVNDNATNDTIIARNVGGTLKLTGNDYSYRASVRPFSESRDLLNAPTYNYNTTGYNISIDNKVDGAGVSIFTKVVVTTPQGVKLSYLPSVGLSYLVLDGTSTPVYRLRAAYKDPATAGNPGDNNTAVYASPQLTEAQISALQNQSVWKMEFLLAGQNEGDAGNAIQMYRTLSRAQTLGEISQLVYADITATMRAEIIAETAALGVLIFGPVSQNDPNNVEISANGNQDGWAVPEGALAPTSILAYGRAPRVGATQGARFNDSAGVPSSARKTIIYCSKQGAGDRHCDDSMGRQYAEGASVNDLEFWAVNSRQVEVSKHVAFYYPIP